MRASSSIRKSHRNQEQWRVLLSRFERSGLSVDAFCREEGLSASSLNRWRRKLLAEDVAGDFIALAPAVQDQGSWTLELELPGGARLRLRS